MSLRGQRSCRTKSPPRAAQVFSFYLYTTRRAGRSPPSFMQTRFLRRKSPNAIYTSWPPWIRFCSTAMRAQTLIPQHPGGAVGRWEACGRCLVRKPPVRNRLCRGVQSLDWDSWEGVPNARRGLVGGCVWNQPFNMSCKHVWYNRGRSQRRATERCFRRPVSVLHQLGLYSKDTWKEVALWWRGPLVSMSFSNPTVPRLLLFAVRDAG